MNGHLRNYILACDILWLAVALDMSYGLRYGQFQLVPEPMYTLLLIVGIGVWGLLFTTMSLDCFQGGWRLPVAAGKMLSGTSVLVLAILSSAYVARVFYSRLMLIYLSILLLTGFFLIRVLWYSFLCARHRSGHARRVVLLGSERFTREFAFKISKHPELLYEVVGTLCPVAGPGVDVPGLPSSDETASGAGQLGSVDVLQSFSERGVDEIIVLQESPRSLEFQTFIAQCRSMGKQVTLLPSGYDLYTSKPKLIEIDGLPLISLEPPSTLPGARLLKRGMDLVLGLLLMPFATCIFLVSGAVLLCHKRKVLRRERRVGQHGQTFWMYRLDIDRDEMDGPAYERHMRDLAISEIPQLWNVLAGDMSLVGPRPESPARVKNYSDWQKERLKAKPGLTGLAQVNGLREHHGSEDKARFDLQYLLEWSLFNDFILILQTLGTLVQRCLDRARAAEAPNESFPRGASQIVRRPTSVDARS